MNSFAMNKILKILENRLSKRATVLMTADPTKWQEHLYGLTPERWKALGGKSFWITGAGTGYGRCLACALAAAGAQVFLTGRRVEKLQETIQETASLKIATGNCYMIEADIADPEQILKACDRVRSLCSALDGLVNNAAIPGEPGISKPLQGSSPEYWNRMMNVNVTAPWLVTRSIFPHMRASSHVRVLFVTSEAGWTSTPGSGMYNVSKAALNSLACSMAEEYAHSLPGEDIQINALVPGEARTEMNQNSTQNPYAIVSMALILLSHPKDGPNGRFFHRDGRHLGFGYTDPYGKSLI